MYTIKEVRKALKKDKETRHTLLASGRKDTILLDVTKDRQADIALLDLTGDGSIDAIAIDSLGQGYYDTLLIDSDGNDIPDTVVFGNLQAGTVDDVLQGPEVETAILDMANTIVAGVEAGKAIFSKAEELSKVLEDRIVQETVYLQKMAKEAKREERKEENRERLAKLKQSIQGKFSKR